MKTKIGVIGNGNVGSALQRGLERGGYEVRSAGKEADALRSLAGWADTLILAVPYAAIDDVLATLGAAKDGKIVVDVTNALTPDFQLALGFTTSGAEELQRKAPKAKVVKAFNTTFAQHMDKGHVKSEPIAAFIAGDDPDARKHVTALAAAIGFDAVDAGPLRNARLLESLGYLNIQLGVMLKLGTDIGFKLVR
jgi:predicted dinucleotide-binding enzyme